MVSRNYSNLIIIIIIINRVEIKENEKSDKSLDLARKLKKVWNMVDGDTNCNWCLKTW